MVDTYFGQKFLKQEEKIQSFKLLETFIDDSHKDWNISPDTTSLVKKFDEIISQMPDSDLAFLLCHSGYIPEQYEADSSQETLYSKLVEALVKHFSLRIGFNKSYLPTQKSSMEDVTITDGNFLIVADSKAFRLGRSQGAPNVKDVLKHSDIRKWMSAHKNHKTLGGLVTFPYQHDWKKGSDFYQYTTDPSLPTMTLYYEHLSFILLSGLDKTVFINTLSNYEEIFPQKNMDKTTNRNYYFSKIEKFLFGNKYQEWLDFRKVGFSISKEKVIHTLGSLEDHVSEIHRGVAHKINSEQDIQKIKDKLIEIESLYLTEKLQKQIENIKKHREF